MPDSATAWTVAHQASLSMGFFKQEYWSGLPFPPPGHIPHSGLNLQLLCLLRCRQILYSWATWEALINKYIHRYIHTHLFQKVNSLQNPSNVPSVCCQHSDSKHWENLPFNLFICQFSKMAYRIVCFLPHTVNMENLNFWFKGKRNLNRLSYMVGSTWGCTTKRPGTCT